MTPWHTRSNVLLDAGAYALKVLAWLSESGQGSAQKRFNGDGNSGAAEYKVWKRWDPAALVVKNVCGMPPKALGPWMYTLLDGQAALALESIDIKDMCTEGGEDLVFQELDQRFPNKVQRIAWKRPWRGPFD